MIKLMTVGFMGLAVLSCSKGDNQPEYQKPLGFSGYTARPASKANASFVQGTELPSGQAFGVYAYNTGTSETFDPESISTYGKFMTDVAVTYSGGGASNPQKYPYSPMRYWPNSKESNRLAFFAYYPHNGAGITRSGFADFTVTVQDTPADQVDFMLSDVVANQMYGAAGSAHNKVDVVDLKFYHMLTQVRFKGKTDAPAGATVKVTALTLENIVNKGTLAPDAAATSSVWTEDETSTTDYTVTLKDIALPSTTVDPSAEAVALTEADQTLLLMPQTLKGALSITYSITTTTPARTIKETVSIPLNSLLEKWERNNQIVYTLNIGLHPIEISASTEDWSDDEYIVIVE
jgi:hypothetical protein